MVSECEQNDHDRVWQDGREAGYRDALIALAEHRGQFFDELDRNIADSLRRDQEYVVAHDAAVERILTARSADMEAQRDAASMRSGEWARRNWNASAAMEARIETLAEEFAHRAKVYESHPEHDTDRYLDGFSSSMRVAEKCARALLDAAPAGGCGVSGEVVEMTTERLAANLRAAVKASGLAQQEVAERVGMKPDVLSKILSGKRRTSSLELSLICTATHTDVLGILEADPLHGPSLRRGYQQAMVDLRRSHESGDLEQVLYGPTLEDGDFTSCGMKHPEVDAYCDLPIHPWPDVHHADLFWQAIDERFITEQRGGVLDPGDRALDAPSEVPHD